MPSLSAFVLLPRPLRRHISRDQSRRFVRYNGPAPRYEPARDLSCQTHHRKQPCRRCP